MPNLSDDFQSYLEMFDEYPTELLDPIYEDDCQPSLCSDSDTSKDIVCLKKVTHDCSSQPPVITLPCLSIARVLKSEKKPRGNSIYHFAAEPVRVR